VRRDRPKGLDSYGPLTDTYLMPFLQRKPQTSTSAPLYTLGLNKTILVVGLGNVGKKFDGTRHNIGFAAVDAFAQSQDFSAWIEKTDLGCLITDAILGNTKVIVIKPTTLMNLSGEAVQAVSSFYKVGPENSVVVYDELDIPFGQIRTRIGGSSAGHNGIKSVIKYFGEEFGRVRIGIGPKSPESIDSVDFVLGKFNKEQSENVPALTNEASAILTEYIFGEQLSNETRTVITL
jgi:PTH1 family peptidyl-tRNA hydrolase